jgi:hypothetical protein
MLNRKSQADYKSQIEPQKPIETTSSPNNAKPYVACSFSSSEATNSVINFNKLDVNFCKKDLFSKMKTAFNNANQIYKLSIIVKHKKQILFIMLNPKIVLKGNKLFTCQFKKRFNNMKAIQIMDGNYIAQFPMEYLKQVSSILHKKPSYHEEYIVELNELVVCSPV